MTLAQDCELCRLDGGEVLFRDQRLRVVLVNDPDIPGYLRVIWNAHTREMSDLTASERTHCMKAVFAAESVLRAALAPDKMNMASLGNLTPHVHWHVIARFQDDAFYPQPIWAARQRATDPVLVRQRRVALHDLRDRLVPILQE